ncbi:MAG: hypothetical protein KDA89_18265, partial [Planctomycetaceae bacterium]|nr:hypothetical protein [Planctomycetaceae bacterium]
MSPPSDVLQVTARQHSTDATVARLALHNTVQTTLRALVPAVVVCCVAGCKGKSLIDDNPVFTEAPPR